MFVVTDRDLHEAALVIPIGLLPGQASLLGSVSYSWQDEDIRWRLVSACGGSVIDGRGVIGAAGPS